MLWGRHGRRGQKKMRASPSVVAQPKLISFHLRLGAQFVPQVAPPFDHIPLIVDKLTKLFRPSPSSNA